MPLCQITELEDLYTYALPDGVNLIGTHVIEVDCAAPSTVHAVVISYPLTRVPQPYTYIYETDKRINRTKKISLQNSMSPPQSKCKKVIHFMIGV